MERFCRQVYIRAVMNQQSATLGPSAQLIDCQPIRTRRRSVIRVLGVIAIIFSRILTDVNCVVHTERTKCLRRSLTISLEGKDD